MSPPVVDSPPDFTVALLRHAIIRRHAAFQHRIIFIDELRTKSGMGGGERYVDLWGIRPGRDGLTQSVAYEIKTSRSDFLRDRKIANKHDGARALSNEFWFVAPPGVVKVEEVPDWAGLLEPAPDYDDWKRCYSWAPWASSNTPRLKQVVRAPMTTKIEPTWNIVVSMIGRRAIEIESASDDSTQQESA